MYLEIDMKHVDDSAMSLGGIAFGMFCLVSAIVGGIYIISLNSKQPAITDTYGNTIGSTANTSQQLVTNLTYASGDGALTPLILIAVVMLLIGCIVAIWIASKSR